MGDLPREWERVPVYYRWPDPLLQSRDVPGGIVVEDSDGAEVIRSDAVADDLLDDLEKGAPSR